MLLDNTKKYLLIINKISSLFQMRKIDSETKNQLADLAYKGFQSKDYEGLYNFTTNENNESLYPIQEIILRDTIERRTNK